MSNFMNQLKPPVKLLFIVTGTSENPDAGQYFVNLNTRLKITCVSVQKQACEGLNTTAQCSVLGMIVATEFALVSPGNRSHHDEYLAYTYISKLNTVEQYTTYPITE